MKSGNPSGGPVVILGPDGSGLEYVYRPRKFVTLRNCPEQLLGLGGVCSPRVEDGHRWVFRDSLYKVFLIIYACMSETFLTYKSDVCLDCIV